MGEALSTARRTMVPLAEFGSACPEPRVRAETRVDPFWHGLWVGGSQTTWLSHAVAQRRQVDGVGRMRWKDTRVSPADGMDRLLNGRMRERGLAALAALGLWRTLTGEQLAAFTGYPELGAAQAGMRPAWAAGVVERGSFVVPEMSGASLQRLTNLYRPLEGKPFEELAGLLSYGQWVQLTAGRPWTRGSQHDRHNILAAELALRIAEFCETGAVLGEALGELTDLTGYTDADPRAATDAVIVRSDGTRIAVELTASIGAGFVKKVERWAEALYRGKPDGLCSVVFVEAAGHQQSHSKRADVARIARRTVAKVAYGTPGYARAGIPERLAVASWTDWFPEPGMASPKFRALECHRPTGSREDRWQPVALLDPLDLPGDESGAGMALLDNARHLSSLPFWLRSPDPAPDFTDVMFERAGVDQIPVPPPAK